jgi:sugar transferase (PEP-CTERM/EpsH1 system associated)
MEDILFLAHRFPYPPDRGDKIRSWNMLKALGRLAPVHCCTLVDDPRDLDHLAAVEAVCASVHSVAQTRSKFASMAISLVSGQSASVVACGSAPLQAKVDHILATCSIGSIFAFSGQMAQFVPSNRRGRRFVMDFVDVDSAKFLSYADQATGMAAAANAFEARRLARFEKAVALQADVSLFVSDAEAKLFRETTGMGPDRVRALENGIDLDYFNPQTVLPTVDTGHSPLMVFTGQMDYRPNIDAVAHFVRTSFPIIRSHLPNARFAIVGRAPTEEVRALSATQGVLVTGEVADTRPWLIAADVVVAPLLLARGIQNKILEAMAMARPVVASPAAAEGIDAAADDGLHIAIDGRTMAEQVLSLIANPERAAQFGSAARARMIARYSWDAQLAGLKDLVTLRPLEKAA